MKVLFMGTPDFAQKSLEQLVENNYDILGVVTNPDKPKGRGMKMLFSPVKEYAVTKKLTIYQPTKVKNNEEFINEIRNLNPDIICVVAYGKILPKEILQIPKYGCINVHASLLPKYRGAAPIQWAVINGDKVTGVTTMYMDVGMDTGDMILKEEVEIGEDETTGELWERLSVIGANLLIKTLKQIEEKKAPRIRQTEDFTMAPMLNKEMTKIDWDKITAIQIKNLVRGLNPIMGAFTIIDNKKIKLWKVDVIQVNKFKEMFNTEKNLENIENGTVLLADSKKGLYIKAREGIIKVIEIQGENAKKMKTEDFLRGNKLNAYF